MKRIHVEEIFDYKGYKCVCIFVAGGWRCGYVSVDNTHPWFRKNYYDECPDEIMCHWGLTYSGDGRHFDNEDENLWWFGFDCGHYGDGIDYDTAKEYGLINDKEYFIQKELMDYFNGDDETIKDKEFVKENCKMIVEQLIAVEKRGC